MSAFSASELFAFPAHIRILRRVATDLLPLSSEAIGERRAEGIGVWSFLAMVALVSALVMGMGALVATTPWGVAALSIQWEKNEEILYALGSDPSEVKVSSFAEVERPGSSKLSKKIADKAGNLEGSVVADWFDAIGAPDAATSVREALAETKRKRLVSAVVGALMILLAPLLTAHVAIRVIDGPADLGADDLAAPLTLWAGFWAMVILPFTLCSTLFVTSGGIATVALWAQIVVIVGEAWQLHAILGGVMEAELRQSLIVYVGSSLLLWGAGVGFMLALSPVIG